MTSALTTELVHIPGRKFLIGSDRFYPEERPVHEVEVDEFWIERHLVTNAQFACFVGETRYVTLAERPLDPQDYPGAPRELLKPGGLVFRPPDRPVPLDDATQWWAYVPGANWRHPRGPETDLEGLSDHPVVQVSYEDAEAYGAWRGARMPTEAEWEMAARGGLDAAIYSWGDERQPEGRQMANTWQGEFPRQNLALDGYEGTSPVGAFPANGYGLADMAGNVWEWTADWWQDRNRSTAPCCSPNSRGRRSGNAEQDSASPGERFGRKVIKGGSHLCAPNYCLRFRPSARQPEALDTTTCHIGFRCASSVPPG
jgi:formylglycine-generating enzyme